MGRNRRLRKGDAAKAAAANANNVIRFAAGQALAPDSAELGVSGTINWSGELVTESNSRLYWNEAYGTLGARRWGEWEKLVRTDHVAAFLLDSVVAPIRAARVDVEATDSTPEAAAIASYVRDCFVEWTDPLPSELFSNIIRSALTYGFSVNELVWETREDDRLPGGVGYSVRAVAPRLASSISQTGWLEEGGELKAVVQESYDSRGLWRRVEIPAEKLLLLAWDREGNNFAGYSAFRSVWYIAKMRSELLRILGIGSSREALGVPVASMDKDVRLTDGQRDSLQTFLENMVAHENAAAQLPPGVKLDWVFSPGANKGHVIEAWERLGLAMLQRFSMQDAYLGTSDTGSRAVGETHLSSRHAFVEGVKTLLESTLNGVGSRPYTGLVRKIVDANWGKQTRYPVLKITMEKPKEDALAYANSLRQLYDAGLLTKQPGDENHVREKLGLPLVDAGKDVATPDAEAKLGDWRPKRELRRYEKHLALGEIVDFFEDFKADFEEDVQKKLVAAIERLSPTIQEAMKDGDPSELVGVELDAAAIEKEVSAYVEKSVEEGRRQVAGERRRQPDDMLEDRASGESGRDLAATRMADEDDEDETMPRAKFVKAQAKATTKRIKQRAEDMLLREAIDVARLGGKTSDVTKRVVDKTLEASFLKQDAAGFLTKGFNVGREEFADEYGDKVKHVVYSAVLDSNVCENCAALDGEVFEFDSEEHLAHIPPLSGASPCLGADFCRCLLVYEFNE